MADAQQPVSPQPDPDKWRATIDRAIVLVTLLTSLVTAIIGGCNGRQIATVQEHQQVNGEKIDAAATAADAAKTKVDDHAAKVEQKLATIEKAVKDN